MCQITILFVEDDIVLIMATCESLEDLGISVTAVYFGHDAIEAINGLEYITALLTDIDLGSSPDGFDVARHARKLYPHLPVVFVSGTMEALHAANGVTGSAFVAKPFQPLQIMAALDEVIRLEAT